MHDRADFLGLFAEVCRLFRTPEDYLEASRSIVRALAEDGVAYAEVYVSPEIFARLNLDRRACLEAIDEGFRDEGRAAGIRCRILLDAVRHWGPESAHRVLGLFESAPLSSIVGFGMGGDETAVPATAFFRRVRKARALGLKTSVHAGEWAGPESVRDALDSLQPDRVDHGIAAARDPDLLERLADRGRSCAWRRRATSRRAPWRASRIIRCRASSRPACASRSAPMTRSFFAPPRPASTTSRATIWVLMRAC